MWRFFFFFVNAAKLPLAMLTQHSPLIHFQWSPSAAAAAATVGQQKVRRKKLIKQYIT